MSIWGAMSYKREPISGGTYPLHVAPGPLWRGPKIALSQPFGVALETIIITRCIVSIVQNDTCKKKYPQLRARKNAPKGPEHCINSTLGGTTWKQFADKYVCSTEHRMAHAGKIPAAKGLQTRRSCRLKPSQDADGYYTEYTMATGRTFSPALGPSEDQNGPRPKT